MTVVDDIKDQLDIVEVISEHLTLKKAGRNFKALCPFHNEKTPSFIVNPERQIWHCFGCGKGGDIFGFIKEIEGVEFKEALRILADKAGIELRPEDPEVKNARIRMAEMNEHAANFFHYLLSQKIGQHAYDYLKKRQVSLDTIKKFRIGYAPDSFDSLLRFLRKKNYHDDEIVQAGLATRNEDGQIYDKFRARLMFPIRNLESQTIAFGGRTLKEDIPNIPKYLNSPQTLIYNKSSILYNLDQARSYVRKTNYFILVEGYMDVIAVWQAKDFSVIASSGTALTEQQLNILKRYTSNLLFAFDSDTAGSEATKRGIELALSKGFNLKIVDLGKFKDPDEMIKENPLLWKEAIKKALPVIEFFFKKSIPTKTRFTPENQKKISAEILPLLAKLQSPIDQDHYLQKLAVKLDLDTKTIQTEFKNYLQEREQYAKIQDSQAKDLNKNRAQITLGEFLVATAILEPRFQKIIFKQLNETDFPNESLIQNIFKIANTKKILPLNTRDFLKELDYNTKNKLNLILTKVEIENEKLASPLDSNKIEEYIRKCKLQKIRQQIKKLHQNLKTAEENHNQEQIKRYTLKISNLTKKIYALENDRGVRC